MFAKTLFVLFALVALSSAQVEEFTAKVLIKEPTMTNGGVSGNLVYSWATGMFQIFMPGQDYNELYDFNDNLGMEHFKDQYLFKNGNACDCMTGVMDYSMPMFYADPAYWKVSAGNIDDLPSFGEPTDANYYPGAKCQRYDLIAGTTYASRTNLKDINLDASGNLCRARFKDGREIFVIPGSVEDKFLLTQAAFTFSSDLCVCSKPLDICLVVDRSSSINRAEWNDFRSFLLKFKDQFEISSQLTQMSVVSFNTEAWLDLALKDGISAGNVQSAMTNMNCPLPTSEQLCVENTEKSWTSVTEGIHMCADQLASSTRNGATPVMVVLTDGYHNVKYHSPAAYDTSRDFCYPECSHIPLEGSPEWITCATPYFKRCRDDLKATMAYAVSKVPDLVSYAVGIGDLIAPTELLMIAQGDQSKVMTADSFAKLADASLEIVSRACDANDKPCGDGCCGFCVCQNCQAPDFCDDGVFCTRDFVKPGTKCCATEVRPCDNTASTNKCEVFECYEEACRPKPKACPASNACFTYACNPADGVCEPTLKPQSGTDLCHVGWCDTSGSTPVLKIKDVAKECAGANPNPCTAYGCDAATGDCTTAPKPFPVDTNVCHVYSCDPTKTTTNPFTWVDRTCPDDAAGDICIVPTCDATNGCATAPVKCITDATNKCDLSYCDPKSKTPDSPCVASFVQCEAFKDGDKCQPLKKSGGSIDANGCNKKTGLCEYEVKTCSRIGCDDYVCNKDTGNCDPKPTAGCGIGFCAGEADSCKSDVCVRRQCDTTKGALNCDAETKAINCDSVEKQPDTCLTVDTTFIAPSDPNKVNPGCDPLDGNGDGDVCIYKPVDCAAKWATLPPLTDKCIVREMDSTVTGCCVERPMTCDSGNPCIVSKCVDGACVETPACPASDACTSRSCVADSKAPGGFKCVTDAVSCVSTDPCLVLSKCDATGSGCVFVPFNCDDKDPCTTDTCAVDASGKPTCSHTQIDCNDSNECTVDTCDNGECKYTENSCDDKDLCTTDTCDAVLGCVSTPINVTDVCNDFSLCTTDTCDPAKGCVNTEIVCDDKDPCTDDVCDPYNGCQFPTVVCEAQEECRIGFCNAELLGNGTKPMPKLKPGPNGRMPPNPLCDTRNLACYAGESIVFISGALAAGAIVGIIVGIVACLACTGGGVFAAYKRAGLSGQDAIVNNPLYKGEGHSGVNPLNRQ